MKPGTLQHKELFCSTFIKTHEVYEPSEIAWPVLEDVYLQRLRAIPFWGTARAVESRAGIMVDEFARTIEDPVIREAMQVQAAEEARHARLMQVLIERYDIPAKDVTVDHRGSSRDEFVVFGYEECLDSFLGFGLFALGRKLQFFPSEFLAIFDRVLLEEARHVTFFVNWIRYEEAREGRDHPLVRLRAALTNYGRALRKMIDSFAGDARATGFVAAGADSVVSGVTPAQFLEAALVENRRYMAKLDARLIKPAILPTVATALLLGLRALPPRDPSSTAGAPSTAGAAANGAPPMAPVLQRA
jgi:hypothetical protein